MLSNFFLLPGRTYLNNAIVIADILHVISYAYGDVKNFNIKFKKPFNSQAELKFSKDPLEGHTVGSFNTNESKIYFSYVPIDIELASKTINSNDINYFNLSYEITDAGRGIVQESFEKEFGPMTSTDKVIFAVCDIPDTGIINKAIKYQQKPKITITKAEHIGNRRFKYSVMLDGVLFSERYCSVKEFNI